jgi:hypothetical protein
MPRHVWLRDLLAEKHYTQSDLAKAWGVHDAGVSRFINIGKPDLTPERQIVLVQMLIGGYNMAADLLTFRDTKFTPWGCDGAAVFKLAHSPLPGPLEPEVSLMGWLRLGCSRVALR